MKRQKMVIGILVVLVAAYIAFRQSSFAQQMAVGAATVAKQTCSLVFVSGLNQNRARALYIDPLLQGGAPLFRTNVDIQRKIVTVRVPGLVRRRAQFRTGLGCTLLHDQAEDLVSASIAEKASAEMAVNSEHRDAVFDKIGLEAAIEMAFNNPAGRPPLNTLAVAVLHDGVLVAERYADGITADSRLPGWSITKSVAATLVGVLVERGMADIHAPGAIAAWRDSDDPRSNISIDHLLRMTSGLLITEGHGGLDPTSRMLFLEPDAASFAGTRVLEHGVGTHYEYMSGSTILAIRAVQDLIGGGLTDSQAFIHDHLLDPLGMNSAILEPDQSGTFVASSGMFATARDWVRFGQLYLDKGRAGDQKLISEEWIQYVTSHTPSSGSSGYGAGFWLRTDDSREAGTRSSWMNDDFDAPGGFEDALSRALPRDAFAAIGFQGQHLHILPTQKIVVVRLGATNFAHDHERLPLDVVAAMKGSGSDPCAAMRRGDECMK